MSINNHTLNDPEIIAMARAGKRALANMEKAVKRGNHHLAKMYLETARDIAQYIVDHSPRVRVVR